MAYREPAVRVTQEFTNALPALAAFALPHVNVGPVFQVVTQKSAGTYAGSSVNLSYPEQVAGSFVDTSAADPTDLTQWPVSIYLKNAILRLLNITGSGAVSPYDNTQFTDATTNIFTDIRAGDVIVVTGSGAGNNGSYTVREKISNNTLKTNEAFAATETGLSYSIRRNIQSDLSPGYVEIPRSTSGVVVDDTQVTLPSALTYSYAPFGALPILNAEVLLSYRALRTDKSADVWEYGRVSELQADFGLDQVVPQNPAVFAAYISLQTAAVKTNLLALNSTYLQDQLLSYQNSFDVLALTDMYAVNVLTHMTSVHTALKAHAEGMSVPTKGLERVGIANRKIVTVATVVDEITTGGSEGFGGTSNLTLTSAASSFITDGVVPGHFVKVTGPSGAVGRYKIASVVSQTQVTVTGTIGSAYTGVTFSIEKDLQKSEQASVLAAYASSIGSRRMVLVWPDVVRGPVGSSIVDLPGYFLGASVGALTTGLPTQQGFTNMSVAYFTGVRHSSKYFDRDQMNTMAGGGIMIFAQDVLDVSALYIRHQLTTDTSAIKFQEFSITKNVDFIAKFIRTNHKNFIGKYNVVDAALDDLKANAKGIITYLKDSTRLPKIGGVIKSGKLVELREDSVNIDSVIERYQLDIPVPLNNLDITIVV